METRKILFTGLGTSTVNVIRTLLEGEKYIPLFAEPAEAEELIAKEKPSLLAIGDISINENFEILHTMKKIASDRDIPLITVVSGGKIKPYITAHSEGVTAIITTPILKKDFLFFLDRYIEEHGPSAAEPETGSGPSDTLSGFTGSLILNILSQNRIIKKFLKKKKPTQEFQQSVEEKIEKLREEEELLWDALENRRFRLHYQPVINFETGKLSGFEALIRINDPEKGVITPDKFISVAENSAIIFPLGLWIIEEACRQIGYWKGKFLLDTPLRVNINLSAKQFIHPELPSHIFEIIDRYSVEHSDIGFELTESAFMDDMESANISLLELRSRKFPLYMDDFGTGYSSLSYLMHFPMDIIKIDQSFVKWMHIDEQSETLVRSIVHLAHNMGLKVVAEGVDDESHIEILKDCGCDYGQGYLFSKPLSAEKTDEFISEYFKYRTI